MPQHPKTWERDFPCLSLLALNIITNFGQTHWQITGSLYCCMTFSQLLGMLGIFSFLFFLFFFFCLFIFVFLGLYLGRLEVPRLGVRAELQLPAYPTATAPQHPSHICNLHHSSQQCWSLNPLSEARDGTGILMDASGVHYHWATSGTPNVGHIFNCVTVIFFSTTVIYSLSYFFFCLIIYKRFSILGDSYSIICISNIFSSPIISLSIFLYHLWPYKNISF